MKLYHRLGVLSLIFPRGDEVVIELGRALADKPVNLFDVGMFENQLASFEHLLLSPGDRRSARKFHLNLKLISLDEGKKLLV